jgi:ABC-type multidrug transport system ATPase subunit
MKQRVALIIGKEIKFSREEILKNVGALVEGPAFYGDLNAYDNMKIVALMKNVSTENILPILETMGLEKTCKKRLKSFRLE